jgi:hypothetical protein
MVLAKSCLRVSLVLILVTIFCFTFANIYDYGVREERDEFTHEYSCYHRVDNSLTDDSGIHLTYTDTLGYTLFIRRDFRNDPNSWVFSSASNTPYSSDLVYFRFPDGEVISKRPDYVAVNTEIQKTDLAGWGNVQDLVFKILSSPGDLRVRFVGTHGSRDFTIYHAVITTLASGFGQVCVQR